MPMEEEKEGDIRVPLISSIFCLCVTTGGIFLVLYVFSPTLSQPWFPIAAFVLIGSPWLFWLMTYFYTYMKACFNRQPDNQIMRTQTNRNASSATTSAKESEFPLAYSVR